MRWTAGTLVGITLTASSALAAGDGIEISRAWTPAPAHVGADTPLYMTIANRAASPDSLLRARCPVANFAVKYATDHGEGAPSLREVKAITIPAGGTMALAPDGYVVMLVQTRASLEPGQTFTCTVTFQMAGAQEISVLVVDAAASRAP
jgi:copper(I)-binding protein